MSCHEVNVQFSSSSRWVEVRRLLLGHGVWAFIWPWRSTSNLSCLSLKVCRHYKSSTQCYCNQKEIRGKIYLLPPCCMLVMCIWQWFCIVAFFILFVYNRLVNREKEKPRMYILTEIRWKKKKKNCLKSRSWEKWAFLEVVSNEKKKKKDCSYSISLIRSSRAANECQRSPLSSHPQRSLL